MRARGFGLAAALAVAGCDWSLHRMIDQPRCDPDEATPLFPNGTCNQLPPEGTVPWRAPGFGPEVATGSSDGGFVPTIPEAIRIDRALLERGRTRFETFCAVCHGLLGDGVSEVAENMKLRPPPSLHLDRLVRGPDGRLFAIASSGYGLMPSYAAELSVEDRWAVVAYVRVLQRSQDLALDQLPPRLRQEALSWLR